MDNNPQYTDIPPIIVHGFAALFGGLVNTINAKPKGWIAVFANITVASFSGFLAGMLALYFLGDKEYITLSITGSAGYLGKEGLDFLTKKVFFNFLKTTVNEFEKGNNQLQKERINEIDQH